MKGAREFYLEKLERIRAMNPRDGLDLVARTLEYLGEMRNVVLTGTSCFHSPIRCTKLDEELRLYFQYFQKLWKRT
ncbi:MAG: hypothetical protein HXX80_05900 [Nitrososphaerales archaeon]|nr:hypothetical protein [Nitrososphaerales archaeon]